MNIEQAIDALIMLRELMLFDPNTGEVYPPESLNEDNRNLYDATEIAIEALREKAVKSKGCEYCDDNFKFWQTQISGELPNVRYCPMCGRQLEVEPMSNTLLPCPFCGGEAEATEYNDSDYTIMCKNCHAEIGWREQAEAIAAWNRRVDARQLALKTRVCPMCEDCPDGCPVETPKDSRNIVTNADRVRSMTDEYRRLRYAKMNKFPNRRTNRLARNTSKRAIGWIIWIIGLNAPIWRKEDGYV